MAFQVGQVVGDYRVIDVLGAGGMGAVYKVQNIFTHRTDAMKVLLPGLGADSAQSDRFLREIRILATMRHPNIAALHTAFRVDDQILMVMEFLEGLTVDARLRNGRMAVNEAVDCARQVLAALGHAHTQGIVHRDIKPSNIVITKDGVVKLIDFGIARDASDRPLTISGMLIGSLLYMAPEVIQGKPVDARSDVYSLGLTLYQMLSGKKPVEGENEYAVMRAQVEVMPESLAGKAGISPVLSSVVMTAIAKEPSGRYQTAADFADALAACVGGGAGTQAAFETPGMTIGRVAIRGFSNEVLAALEQIMAPHMGPISRHLVRKAAAETQSIGDLWTTLAAQVPPGPGRDSFIAASKARFPDTAPATLTPRTPLPSPSKSAVAWDPAALESVRQRLATFVGPLAKMMTERAAKKALSMEELLVALSLEIESPAERERFLNKKG